MASSQARPCNEVGAENFHSTLSLNLCCPQCNTTSVLELALASRPVNGPAVASPPSNAEAEKDTQHLGDAVLENGSSKHSESANVKETGVRGSREKDEALLLASVRNTTAPSSCDVAEGENSNGLATKPVCEVKRNSKKGEALKLRRSDISPLFGLHLPKAAKELGISTSSLKKACRNVGIHRWPGRKVRGLESTIDRLQRVIVGQGADSGKASMRSEIPKLQQELNELFHGTPAQIKEKMHFPAVITTNLNRRLYQVHGSRSKHKESARPNPRKYIRPSPRRKFNSSSRLDSSDTEGLKASDLEGLLPEVHDIINVAGREVPEGVVQVENGNNTTVREELLKRKLQGKAIVTCEGSMAVTKNGNNMTPNTETGEEGTGDGNVAVEEEGATVAEPSTKRPKTESRCENCGKCC